MSKHSTTVYRQFGYDNVWVDVAFSCSVELFPCDDGTIQEGCHTIQSAEVDEIVVTSNGREIRFRWDQLAPMDVVKIRQEVATYMMASINGILSEATEKVMDEIDHEKERRNNVTIFHIL